MPHQHTQRLGRDHLLRRAQEASALDKNGVADAKH
jgi:hypothetical protein